MGVDPYLIAPTLTLALAQRLVRTFAPGPKKEIPIDEATRTIITKQFADLPEEVLKLIPLDSPCTYAPIPSKEFPSGMKGRMAVVEALTIDKDIERVILKNPVEPEIYKLARSKGMTTLREDAIIKALSGLTTIQEAYGV